MRKTGKALQRLLSAFVTACVLITCVSGLQPASAASIEPGAAAYVTAGETGKNLFSDGSFEAVGKEGFKDYTSTWDFYWFPPLSNGGTMESQAAYVVKDPAGAHDGDYYIKNDQTGWFGIAEPTVELAAGEYEFSAWVRAAEGTLRVNLTIDEGPAGCVVETDALGTSVDIPEGTGWRQLKMRFQIDQPGTYRVRLGMNSIGQEVVEYHFDDFALYYLGQNLLGDGSFERTGRDGFVDYTSDWDFYWFPPLSNGGTAESQAAYIVRDPENARDGDYYIRNDQTGWFGIAEPTVDFAAGEYEFSVWAKAVEGSLRVNFTIDEGPAGCVVETDSDGTIVLDEGSGWQKLTCRFNIDQAGAYRVRLGMNSIGQEVVEYHFDDFRVVSLDGPKDFTAVNEGKVSVSSGDGGGQNSSGLSGEGECTIELSAGAAVISNGEITTSAGMENNKSYLTVVVKDGEGNELSLRDLARNGAISFESSDPNVAIGKGNYKEYYIYGISAGTATITMCVDYNGSVSRASVDIEVTGSALRDGGFEGATDWHDCPYWTVVTSGKADPDSWGYDVNSTFNMTGGNNMYIRMPNGGNQETDGTVLVYQDVYLTPGEYSFASYIRRFPGFEQQDTVDGYDSYNTPVTVGATLLDASGNETSTTWSETYKDDNKMGVGDFEACPVAFEVAEAGTYRLYMLAESEIHVGMGMQVDNMCLVSGRQIDHVEASFGENNTVAVGESAPLVFKAYYADGTEADLSDIHPVYESADTEVATVTSDYKVFGMAAGTVNIYASVTVNGVEYKCTIEATVTGGSAAPSSQGGSATPAIIAVVVVVVAAAATAAVVIVKKKQSKKEG